MLVDDKQAREKILGLYAELVDRLYAQSEVSRGEGWDEVAKLDSDAAKVIESLSAQVAEITKERDQYLQELEDAEADITGYWRRQKQRAEAAEAQVAELKKDAEWRQSENASTYHGFWKMVQAGAINAVTGKSFYRLWDSRGHGKIGCYDCGYFDEHHKELVEAAMNKADAILAAKESGVSP